MLSRVVQLYHRRRFTILFGALLLTVGLYPVVGELPLGGTAIELVLATSLLIVVIGPKRKHVTAIVLFFLTVLVARVIHGFVQSSATHGVRDALWLIWGVLALISSARYTLRPGKIDSERLFAALSTYLLAGVVMGWCYQMVESQLPGSFLVSTGGPFDIEKAVYFSFVTITTLGYGDMVPASQVSRGLAVLEAVSGQIYLAVLVARLVSLYSAARDK